MSIADPRPSVVPLAEDEEWWESVLALKAERSLADFVEQSWPLIEPAVPFDRNWHIDATCAHLEAVTRGDITRLVVNMPPRYGKSTVISVCWPVWEWLREPGQRWIFYSYKNDLARDHSVKRRAILTSDWFRRHWAERFRLTSSLEMRIENSARGVMQASSANAPPHGKGGNRIVIDDPHDPLQAESDLERTKGIQTYRTALYPRLNSKKYGAIVVVMQRLHQADLSGELLEEGGWVHLKLAARSPGYVRVRCPDGTEKVRRPGEPLWPGREDEETLARTERAMGPVVFAGQYQQEPAPPGGYLFRRNWFTIVDHPCPAGRTIRYWDKASTHAGGAYTAGVKMRRGVDGYFYVLDVARGQWSATERERVISQTMALDGPDVEVYIEQEPGGTGKESNQNTILRNPGYLVFSDAITGDKVVRARPYASYASVADSVRLVRGAWNEPYLAEIEMFPNSRYKDQCLIAGTMIATDSGPRPIESIRPGDMVLTRFGYRRVTHAGMTGRSNTLFRLETVGGRSIVGTGNHPVLVAGRGFVPLDAIAGSDRILAWLPEDRNRPDAARRSSSRASHSIASPIPPGSMSGITTGPTSATGPDTRRSIVPSGRRPMGRSRTDMKSTTSTAIRSTIRWTIWNAFRWAIIVGPTPRPATSPGRPSWNIWTASGPGRRSGIAPRKGGPGIGSMPCDPGSARIIPVSRPVAPDAAVNSWPWSGPASGIVPSGAATWPGIIGSRPSWSGRAKDAGPSSSPGSDVPPAIAAVRVRSVMPERVEGPVPVYNLAIEGCPEYFANGILVHNCDASSGAFNKLSLMGEPGEPFAAEAPAEVHRIYLPGMARGSLG